MAERLGEQLLTLVKAFLYTVWTENHVLYPNLSALGIEENKIYILQRGMHLLREDSLKYSGPKLSHAVV